MAIYHETSCTGARVRDINTTINQSSADMTAQHAEILAAIRTMKGPVPQDPGSTALMFEELQGVMSRSDTEVSSALRQHPSAVKENTEDVTSVDHGQPRGESMCDSEPDPCDGLFVPNSGPECCDAVRRDELGIVIAISCGVEFTG